MLSRSTRRSTVATALVLGLLTAVPAAAAPSEVEGPLVRASDGLLGQGADGDSREVEAAAVPVNDDFLDAITIDTPEIFGSTDGATTETGEPNGPVDSVGATVWFRVGTDFDGTFTVSTAGSDFDTVLTVFRGYSLDSLTLVTENDNHAETLQSYVEFEVDPDRDYWVRLGGFVGTTGSYELTITGEGDIIPSGLASYRPGGIGTADAGSVVFCNFYTGSCGEMAQFATRDGWQTHQSGDLDGDGVPSLYSYFPGPDGNGRGRWWQTNLDTGRLSRLTDFGTPTGWQTHLMADMNGDGVDEIVSYYPGNGSWWLTEVRDGIARQRRFTEFGTRDGWQTHRVADMDGDGLDEILSYFPGNGSWWQTTIRTDGVAVQRRLTTYGTASGWAEHLVADVTGDETPELLSFWAATGVWWQTDVSSGTARTSRLTTYGDGDGLANARWGAHVAGDVDGYGKDDLLSYDLATGKWWWTPMEGGPSDRVHVVTYWPPSGWEGHQFVR